MLKDLTVVIPTYNRNDYLIKLLDTIPKSENVCIGDNGGAVTQEIISQYPNFSFVHPAKKLEMFENWNFCINHVKTKWFIIPSDDDLFYPGAFEKIEKTLDKYNDADIILFGHTVIDELGNELSSWKSEEIEILQSPQGFEYFKYGVEARLPAIIFKTAVAKSYGLFDESYVYTAADSLLIQRCMLLGKAVILPEIISAYRVWPDNFTSKYISTPDWLKKIDKWQNEIGVQVDQIYSKQNKEINTRQIKDEVYARNLIAGIVNKRSQSGFKSAFLFFKSVRFPFKSKLITQMRIIKALFIG